MKVQLSMISGKQIRAGRLLLNLDSEELAKISQVGLATIKRFEAAPGIPPSRSGNLEKVKSALEARGVVFLGDPIDSPGVQLVKVK